MSSCNQFMTVNGSLEKINILQTDCGNDFLYSYLLRVRVGDADKKLDALRAPKGAELKCIRKTKSMLP